MVSQGRRDQGHAKAQYNLGNRYANGQGVAKNDSTAAKWYLKAAYQGSANAQYSIGVMYIDGKGCPQDLSEALRWLRKANAQGHDKAAEVIDGLLKVAAAESPLAPIAIGTKVELCSIKAKPELNGQRGVVVKHIAESGRCRVQLDNGAGEFNVKAESLRVVVD